MHCHTSVTTTLTLFAFFAVWTACLTSDDFGEDIFEGMDLLLPYGTSHHGPAHRRVRDTQTCQHVRYGNTTYSLHNAHVNTSELDTVVETKHRMVLVGEMWSEHTVTMRYEKVWNPQRTLSVLEPGRQGSCKSGSNPRTTVQDTAHTGNCVAATNAGFFNTRTGQCLGNIVSNGRIAQDSGGIQNVHFGITRAGQIFTGYLSELELVTLDFEQLVGGVIWLVREGEVYVDESRDIECPDSQETGTLDRFINVQSARTAVGHDSDGHVIMVQVDGKTDKQGLNLNEFAALLKDMGLVNAINLDGGGSATTVLNHTLVSYPSDKCPNSTWNCARAVTTILCAHSPTCSPDPHCSHHGDCLSGRCICHSPWTGDWCQILACPSACSGHGTCLPGRIRLCYQFTATAVVTTTALSGCACEAGWQGDDCSVICDNATFGLNCTQSCRCLNNATCDPVSGFCRCAPGFTGQHCESTCGYGTYGEDCQEECSCPGQCFCHHVTGQCSNHTSSHDYIAAGQCIAAAQIKKHNLVPDQTSQLLVWKWANLGILLVACVSIGTNIWLAVRIKTSVKQGDNNVRFRRRRKPRTNSFLYKSSSERSANELKRNNKSARQPKSKFRSKISGAWRDKSASELMDKGAGELIAMQWLERDSSETESSEDVDESTTLFHKSFHEKSSTGRR